MNAIIWGASGQDGFYLTKILQANKIEVIRVSRGNGDWVQGDINDSNSVAFLIKENKPNFIFHLAANSTLKHEKILENHETIVNGTLNILENVRLFSVHTKVFLTGSGLQFVNHNKAIKENDNFHIENAYSLSRVNSVNIGRYYRGIGIKVYIGYLFHHESAFRKESHISKFIINSIKSHIIDSKHPKAQIFDSSVIKEWAYAKDIMNGVFQLIKQDSIFESCIGTGEGYSILEWIELCCQYKNVKKEDVFTFKGDFKADYSYLVSNPETIKGLGWQPTCNVFELVRLMFEGIIDK